MSIKFSDVEVEYKQFLVDVSKAVAARIKASMMPKRLLTTKEAAEFMGVTQDYLRHNKKKFRPKKFGTGKKQDRLGWDIANL